MSENTSRGSSKLGELSPEVLHKSIAQARESYVINRWLWRGQPVFDHLIAEINVTEVSVAGAIVQNLVKLQNEQRQINVLVFPYGIPVFDGVRIGLEIEQAAAKA
jgi:hypothetical protein